MEQVTAIRNRVVDEVFFALGLGRSGWARRYLGPLFYLPAGHLAQIASHLEDEAARNGLAAAAGRILPDLSVTVTTRGVEHVPPEGPVLIVSNHPGAYDSAVVTASIPRRDLKMVVSDVPFTHALVECSRDFIFVSTDPIERMAALRASIQHLKRGGALLIFPNGEVEADPAIMPGAEKTIGNCQRHAPTEVCPQPVDAHPAYALPPAEDGRVDADPPTDAFPTQCGIDPAGIFCRTGLRARITTR